jgi:transcriptional regulator with XRE-family HTH domain
MFFMKSAFENWLKIEAKKQNLSIAELSRKAKLGPNTLNNIFRGQAKAGVKVCKAIAEVLEMDLEIVYQMAGKLPPVSSDQMTGEDELILTYRQLDEAGQKEALAVVKALREAKAKYD